VRDGLPDGSKAKLLFAMYSHIPPCRADLGATSIFVKNPTTRELADYPGNYVCLQPEGSNEPSYLHLRQFKTQRCYSPNGVKVGMPAVPASSNMVVLISQFQVKVRKGTEHQPNGGTAWPDQKWTWPSVCQLVGAAFLLLL
jgi:hypothetical protein